MQILVFGDSITFGSWGKNGGWVQLLREHLEKKVDLVNLKDTDIDYIVFNLGIGGNTSEEVLRRFESESKERLMSDEEATLFIIELGGNDASIIRETGKNRVSLEDFEQNLNQIISIAKKYTPNVLFLGPVPCVDSMMDPMKFYPSLSLKNSEMQKYDEAMKKVCKSQNIGFISLYNKFIKLDYASLLLDGAHPNTKGHKKIFSFVKSYMTKNGFIK